MGAGPGGDHRHASFPGADGMDDLGEGLLDRNSGDERPARPTCAVLCRVGDRSDACHAAGGSAHHRACSRNRD